MLTYKMHIIGIVGMCLLVGCGNSDMEQRDSEIQDSIIYDDYSGDLSYKRKTHEQILADGGIELSSTITEDDERENLEILANLDTY